jgi:putative tryptophan/tyrosine transport system substrate-binding protein
MRRREFITLVGGAAVTWSLAAFAQPRTPRVGVLLAGRAVPARELEIADELTRIGYVDGHNIAYEIRGAEDDVTRLPLLARELVATRPDVIVGSDAPLAVAFFGATRDIPIVMSMVSDPIALGLSTSMSHPTHNVTGFTTSSLSLAAKRLEILHEAVPATRKVAYLWVPQSPQAAQYESRVRQAAAVLGIKLVSLPLTSEADIASDFDRAGEERVTAVLVEADRLTYRFGISIADECLLRNLPAMQSWPVEVRNGALMSYGPAAPDNNLQAAIYIDRILKGTKVAELPFVEPTEIKLVVNLRTAKAIGIELPQEIVLRADEVIE